MKLYTEEQVRKVLHPDLFHLILPQMTPIELPSDEEIRKEAKSNCEYNQDSLRQFDSKFIDAFTDGVNWMKDKILNQNI